MLINQMAALGIFLKDVNLVSIVKIVFFELDFLDSMIARRARNPCIQTPLFDGTSKTTEIDNLLEDCSAIQHHDVTRYQARVVHLLVFPNRLCH